MNPIDNDLEPRLEQLANQAADSASPARVRQAVRRRALRARRMRGVAAFGAGVTVAAVAVGLAWGGPGKSATDTPVADRPVANAPASGRDQIDTVEPGEPCPGARHASTIAGLASKVPVWAPAQAKLTDSWTCGDTPVLMYGAIQVSFEPGWEGVDEKQKWSEMARDYGGSVETVLGRPAYVHPATSDAPREAVNVVVGGTLVRLLAKDGVPIKNLVQLANSIRLPADVSD